MENVQSELCYNNERNIAKLLAKKVVSLDTWPVRI